MTTSDSGRRDENEAGLTSTRIVSLRSESQTHWATILTPTVSFHVEWATIVDPLWRALGLPSQHKE